MVELELLQREGRKLVDRLVAKHAVFGGDPRIAAELVSRGSSGQALVVLDLDAEERTARVTVVLGDTSNAERFLV